MSLKKLLIGLDGSRFQSRFADLVRSIKPEIVVETGIQTGTSSLLILDALEHNNKGKLYSIDPSPCGQVEEFSHPRWEVVRKLSVDALPEIFRQTGPWDMFLHDSDHSVGCMTMEFELAWDFVRIGGIIAADDYGWGEHKAWKKFIARKSAPYPVNIGSCQYTTRDGIPQHKQNPDELLKSAIILANSACSGCGLQPYHPRCINDPAYLLNIG